MREYYEKSQVMKDKNVLGVTFSLRSYGEVLETIVNWRERQEQHYITMTPPHSVLMCLRDETLRCATCEASMTLPDGVGIIFAANMLHYCHKGRVTGPTLMLKCCENGRAYGLRHFFYGGADGVADKLASKLESRFPGLQVCGTFCPPFKDLSPEETADICETINAAKPDIVWVGLGSPKQERWMRANAGRVKAAAMIGVGAAFDFHSGNVIWAPKLIRMLGIEWAWRLMLNPRGMWKRNLDSFLFVAKVFRQMLLKMTGKDIALTLVWQRQKRKFWQLRGSPIKDRPRDLAEPWELTSTEEKTELMGSVEEKSEASANAGSDQRRETL